MSRFIAPENLRRVKVARSSDLWALAYIIYGIRAGSHLFPNVSPPDALCEIRDLLGSPTPTCLALSFMVMGIRISVESAK